MTDTPVTDTSLEAITLVDLKQSAIDYVQAEAGERLTLRDRGCIVLAIDHIAELIRTGRIRLATPAQKETDE